MVDSTDDGDILWLSGVPEVGTVQDPGGEVFGTTIRALYRSKLGCYPLVGTFLSGGSFEGAREGTVEGVAPGEGVSLVILEVTGVDIKLGISGGEVFGGYFRINWGCLQTRYI